MTSEKFVFSISGKFEILSANTVESIVCICAKSILSALVAVIQGLLYIVIILVN